jgi:twinkle protein
MAWKETHLPCPDQTVCQSSDAYAVDEDGRGKCFSCGKLFGSKIKYMDPTEFTYQYVARRGIESGTHEFFRAKCRVDSEGVPFAVEYPHRKGGVKLKKLGDVDAKDKYRTFGDFTNERGWGPEFFPAGSAKAITLVEGHDDAMAAWQLLGKYPVYSVQSASSAVRDVRSDFDYLNSFEKIYVAFDADPPGEKAAKEVAAIFGYKKAYHVKLSPRKDATEYVEAGDGKTFRNVWHNAARFLPEGIVSSFAQIKGLFDNRAKHPGFPTGFPELDLALKGGLELGRSYLVSGLTGTGKTEFFRALQHRLLKHNPQAVLGVLQFEEDVPESIERLVAYELRQPCHGTDSQVPQDTVLATYQGLVGDENRCTFVRHFGSEDPDVILAKIRFLVAACGVNYVFLDNITVLGTGRKKDDERTELDYLATQLEMLVKELGFCLVFISHENADEGTRGSAGINQVADVWLNIKRDLKTENDALRNLQFWTLFKNRQAGKTGPVGRAVYDDATANLTPFTSDLPQ